MNGTTRNWEMVKEQTLEIVIQGIAVQLIFAEEQNTEISVRVREILKNSYLGRCRV